MQNNRTRERRARVFNHELQIFKRICRAVDTPRSLAAWLLVSNGEYDQYLNLSIKASDYESAHHFADDYLVGELLRKSVALPLNANREEAAFSKWLDAEASCQITNERISSFRMGSMLPPVETTRIIYLAVETCRKILGKLSQRKLSLVYDLMDFGPGATLSTRGRFTRGSKFLNRQLTTTQALLGFGLLHLPPLWRREVHGFKVVDANQIAFVPKNARIDRTITIEADLNIYFQKGIGAVMRRLLALHGVDLDRGQYWNRHLASKAYDDNLSTIDLSAASDTIAFETVKLFLPEDWFELLNVARPEFTLLKDGTLFRLSKFSGMGNGYTFELETLIFYCLLAATKEIIGDSGPIAAFGDDMICSNDVHKHILPALDFLGFKVNEDKTFGNGLFHESCGEDYFRSINVRPFYLRWKDFANADQSLYLYGNLIRRYANRRNSGDSCDSRFLPAWLYCFSNCRKERRFVVPAWDHLDGGFVGNFDESGATLDRDTGAKQFRYLCPEPVKSSAWSDGAYISATRHSSDFTKGREPVRNGGTRFKTRIGLVSTWPNLGPWI